MLRKTVTVNPHDEIANYAHAQARKYAGICDVLRAEIDSILTNASSKIYYGMPVWLIGENPVVGYGVKSNYVNLLFWNGQAFKEPELTAAGKYNAAQIKFTKLTDINRASLRRWLKKSKKDIWDFRDIRTRAKKT